MIIEVSHLRKTFGALAAVDGISFAVERGTCLGLLGPNGAGKTSTVRILECISPATGGVARVLGTEVGLSARSIRARIGVVPQENDLDGDLTVWQNLLVFSRFFDIPRRTAVKRIEAMLSFMDLGGRRTSRIKELSGGMQRRLLIARALINEPEILILDEPTTGLDPQMRHIIWQRLRLLKERGLTMVLTTHYMEEAHQLCDRVAIMDRGRILREGAPRRLVEELAGHEVIEVRDHGSIAEVERVLAGLSYRAEVFGDTVYLAHAEGNAVMERLVKGPFTVLRRPATLEDVFLKLTGRGLNE